MFKRIFRGFGADYHQWLSLVKTEIKIDFRESAFSSGLTHGKSGGRPFLTLIIFYLLTGIVFIPVVLSAYSVFISATLLITYTMFMIGGLILLEYHSVIISPRDYEVLACQPIASRTFFFAKLTNVLFYVLCFSMALSLPALIAYFFVLGFRPLVGMIAFLAVLAANFSTAMGILLFYTVILRRTTYQRLQNFLALVQVGLAFLIYSSFFIIPRLMEKMQVINIESNQWLFLLPSTWFASLLQLSRGVWIMPYPVLALLAIFVTICLLYLSASNLSLDYARQLSLKTVLTTGQSGNRKFIKPILPFARIHEQRVVFKLITNQFLYDNKFKMAVLGILPLTVFYLFIGLEDGPLPDPFLTADFEIGRSGLLYLLIFLFPMMLRTYVTQSDTFQASWIFYATPANIQRLVIAEKNFLMVYFVLPFLCILGIIFYSFFGVLLHVVIHMIVLGLLAHLFLQFAFLYSPDLPFSRPNTKGSKSRNLAVVLILVPFLIYLILPLIFRHVYPNYVSLVVFTVMILFTSLILESLIRVRTTSYFKKHEFTG